MRAIALQPDVLTEVLGVVEKVEKEVSRGFQERRPVLDDLIGTECPRKHSAPL